MTIAIIKYVGDYTDLDAAGLTLFDGSSLPQNAGTLKAWDLYAGYEDGKPKGYFLISPASGNNMELNPLRQLPYVAYLSNNGSAGLLQALLSQIKQVVQDSGYASFFAFNFTDTPDDAWALALKGMSVGSRIGSLFSFNTRN